jgi:hypothetical protein
MMVIILVWVRNQMSPPDWVKVELRYPGRLNPIYLIADSPDGARALEWYVSKVTAFTMGQANLASGYADVQWLPASRYGVLGRREDGSWVVWWLGSGELKGPSVWRYVWGSGKVGIDLPDESRAVLPPKSLLDSVGAPPKGMWIQ